MTKVEIGFSAIVGDEHFAMFEGIHRSRVDVDVRIEFLHRDAQTTHLEETTKRGCSESLAERAGYAPGNEHMLWHFCSPVALT